MVAASIMTKEVKTLRPSNSVLDVIDLLRTLKIRQVPIVDGNNKILGIVTSKSVMKSLLPSYISSGALKDVKFAPELDQFLEKIKDTKNTPITDILIKKYVSISPEVSAMEVAAIFVNTEEHLETVLVVDDEERLLGVISPIDVSNRLWEYANNSEKP